MDRTSKAIYKITNKNRKIYIGKELTSSINFWERAKIPESNKAWLW